MPSEGAHSLLNNTARRKLSPLCLPGFTSMAASCNSRSPGFSGYARQRFSRRGIALLSKAAKSIVEASSSTCACAARPDRGAEAPEYLTPPSRPSQQPFLGSVGAAVPSQGMGCCSRPATFTHPLLSPFLGPGVATVHDLAYRLNPKAYSAAFRLDVRGPGSSCIAQRGCDNHGLRSPRNITSLHGSQPSRIVSTRSIMALPAPSWCPELS